MSLLVLGKDVNEIIFAYLSPHHRLLHTLGSVNKTFREQLKQWFYKDFTDTFNDVKKNIDVWNINDPFTFPESIKGKWYSQDLVRWFMKFQYSDRMSIDEAKSVSNIFKTPIDSIEAISLEALFFCTIESVRTLSEFDSFKAIAYLLYRKFGNYFIAFLILILQTVAFRKPIHTLSFKRRCWDFLTLWILKSHIKRFKFNLKRNFTTIPRFINDSDFKLVKFWFINNYRKIKFGYRSGTILEPDNYWGQKSLVETLRTIQNQSKKRKNGDSWALLYDLNSNDESQLDQLIETLTESLEK